MQKHLTIIALAILLGCATQKTSNPANAGQGDTRTTEVELLNNTTYLITEVSHDKTYGYAKDNPINVGGIRDSSGPDNERRFLNALLGPNGEETTYYRAGSCCGFKTPNGMIDNMGMLDRYRLTWSGSSDTLTLYLNMYDKGNLAVPVGLTARKRN